MSKQKSAQQAELVDEIEIPFAQIPTAFLEAAKGKAMSNHARWLFVILRGYLNRSSKVAFPSYDRIKEDTSWAYDTISKALKELEETGWLSRQKRFGDSTIYRLHLPKSSTEPSTEAKSFVFKSSISPNLGEVESNHKKVINHVFGDTHVPHTPSEVNFPKAENLLVASSEIPSQEIVEPSLANSSNVDSQEKPAAQPEAKRARKPQVDSGEGKASTPQRKMQGSSVSASPSDHQRMMAALATTTNQPILNGAAQGKAIKTILKHYTTDQGIEVLHWMADPKTNWRGKVDWLAVQSFIPEYFRRKAQQPPPQEPKSNGNGFSPTKRDFSRIIANLPEHLR